MCNMEDIVSYTTSFNRDLRKLNSNQYQQVIYVLIITDESANKYYDTFVKIGTTSICCLEKRMTAHSKSFDRIQYYKLYEIENAQVERDFHKYMLKNHREMVVTVPEKKEIYNFNSIPVLEEFLRALE